MLTRPLGGNLTDTPVTDSPFVEQWDVGVGATPSTIEFRLLEGMDFYLLDGEHFALLEQ